MIERWTVYWLLNTEHISKFSNSKKKNRIFGLFGIKNSAGNSRTRVMYASTNRKAHAFIWFVIESVQTSRLPQKEKANATKLNDSLVMIIMIQALITVAGEANICIDAGKLVELIIIRYLIDYIVKLILISIGKHQIHFKINQLMLNTAIWAICDA